MGRELTNLPFEEWVTYVFDHPVRGPDTTHWYLDDDDASEWWDPSRQPEVTVASLTNLFENAASVLAPFSDAQVKQGLWFLLDSGYLAALFELLNPGVALSERTRCISSIYALFERFFAPRCASHLSHLDRAGKSTDEHPLNDVCYMWWDIAPVCGSSQGLDRAELDAACLDVMRMTLNLDSDTCRESALHGLGHCYFEYPTQVKAIINRFLDRHPDLQAELRAYAGPHGQGGCSKNTGEDACGPPLIADGPIGEQEPGVLIGCASYLEDPFHYMCAEDELYPNLFLFIPITGKVFYSAHFPFIKKRISQVASISPKYAS